MNWTQEQRDELVALWNNGAKTYSQLAVHFGVSRSSIAGRMRREKHIRGLPIDASHAHNTRPTGMPRSERRKKKMFTLPARAGQLASIVDVTGCKWPVRDDDAFVGGVAFCNHSTDDGKSYCPYHAQINVASYSRSLVRKTIKSAIQLVEKAA